tara:strand:- start:598 stop:855 length:258 start_codon:yes stop_codon:yes gene_type:complete
MDIINKELLNSYVPDFLNSEDFDKALIIYVGDKLKIGEYHRKYYHKNKSKIAKYYKKQKKINKDKKNSPSIENKLVDKSIIVRFD